MVLVDVQQNQPEVAEKQVPAALFRNSLRRWQAQWKTERDHTPAEDRVERRSLIRLRRARPR